jgi:endonuclease YncB( thermonuclease family)
MSHGDRHVDGDRDARHFAVLADRPLRRGHRQGGGVGNEFPQETKGQCYQGISKRPGPGQGQDPAIKNGSITIRLQGIDATELHYAATLPKHGVKAPFKNNGTFFRQFFGEIATTHTKMLLGV